MLDFAPVERFGPYYVVCGHMIRGGLKSLAAPLLLDGKPEVVYGSCAEGHAQLALAVAAKAAGKKLTLIVALRPKSGLSRVTLAAQALGAHVIAVPIASTTNLTAKARHYVAESPSTRQEMPFGLSSPAMVEGLADVLRGLPEQNGLEPPREVWAAAGSGTLARALQLAWPEAEVHAVAAAAKNPAVGRAKLHYYVNAKGKPVPFARPAKLTPPFPSVATYDAKAYETMLRHHASQGSWFLNVACDIE